MKNGGVVEVIEEDPIFPCAQQPQSIPSYEPPLSTESPLSKSTSPTRPAIKSAAALTLDSWDATLEEYYFGLNSPTYPLPYLPSATLTWVKHEIICTPHTFHPNTARVWSKIAIQIYVTTRSSKQHGTQCFLPAGLHQTHFH